MEDGGHGRVIQVMNRSLWVFYNILQHCRIYTPAYVSIRQHTSAYVSIIALSGSSIISCSTAEQTRSVLREKNGEGWKGGQKKKKKALGESQLVVNVTNVVGKYKCSTAT
jgi:hypothetical protein